MIVLIDVEKYGEITISTSEPIYIRKDICQQIQSSLSDILLLAKLKGCTINVSNFSRYIKLSVLGLNVSISIQINITVRRIIDSIFFIVPYGFDVKDLLNKGGIKKIGDTLYTDTCHDGKINLLKCVSTLI